MIPRNIAIPVFILLCVIQLYVAGGMILKNEKVLTDGTVIKLRTAPIDPNDPFRGKYIFLNLLDNLVDVAHAGEWKPGEVAYVTFRENAGGFSVVDQLLKTEPVATTDYLKVKVGGVIDQPGEQKVYIEYPFDRLYLEETKAPEAERIYLEATGDTSLMTHVRVHIRNGAGVLEDVYVGDQSIREMME